MNRIMKKKKNGKNKTETPPYYIKNYTEPLLNRYGSVIQYATA